VTAPRSLVGVGGVCGIGVDAVDVARFRRVLARRPNIVDRLFTETERAYAERSRDPGPRLAVRFAAKEAVLKALGVGVGAAGFRDVEVVRAENGEPGLALSGRAAALSLGRGISRWHVSLTHTDVIAVATVVAEGSRPADTRADASRAHGGEVSS
jgi:holo-[acyl-carrier protein] synthase